MPFATGQDVMRAVEQMVIRLFAHLNEKFRYAEVEGVMVPVPLDQLVSRICIRSPFFYESIY